MICIYCSYFILGIIFDEFTILLINMVVELNQMVWMCVVGCGYGSFYDFNV
jgi:hypothetical protein